MTWLVAAIFFALGQASMLGIMFVVGRNCGPPKHAYKPQDM